MMMGSSLGTWASRSTDLWVIVVWLLLLLLQELLYQSRSFFASTGVHCFVVLQKLRLLFTLGCKDIVQGRIVPGTLRFAFLFRVLQKLCLLTLVPSTLLFGFLLACFDCVK